MPALDSSYHGANWPETFKAKCEPGTAPGPAYHILTIGPVLHFLTEGQLRQISQAIDTALLAAERAKVAESDRAEVVPGWTLDELRQHAG